MDNETRDELNAVLTAIEAGDLVLTPEEQANFLRMLLRSMDLGERYRALAETALQSARHL